MVKKGRAVAVLGAPEDLENTLKCGSHMELFSN
jgi:hypothetical protein